MTQDTKSESNWISFDRGVVLTGWQPAQCSKCNLIKAEPTHLQVRNDGIVHVLLLLPKKLRGNAVQAVGAELVVAEHVRKHIEHHSSVDAGFHVFSFTVRAALESCVPENRATRTKGPS